jgi:hypothetical protein
MDSKRLRHRAVALVSAYAVALQGLLTAFVPVAFANPAAPLAILCSHGGADGQPQPVRHDLPCASLCAALGHGVAGPVPPDLVFAAAAPRTLKTLEPAETWVTPRLAFRVPQSPRAPPRA